MSESQNPREYDAVLGGNITAEGAEGTKEKKRELRELIYTS